MPRAARLGRDEILDGAVAEFWSAGYRGTSVDGLVAAVGVSRARLYAEFGDKDGLFAAVLDRYADRVVTDALRPLAAARGLAGVDSYFRDLLTAEAYGGMRLGCLMTTTMAELGDEIPEFAARTVAHLERVTGALLVALTRAREGGELARHVGDLPALARGLAIVAQGAWTATRAGADPQAVLAGIEAVLASIRRQ